MPNVRISDLPLATLPLVGADSFFEVQTIEGGEDVSRKVSGDDLTFTAGVIQGTSIDDPAVAAGTFDGQLLYRNANAIQTGSVGFAPAGDDFIIQNFADGGDVQLRIRDGTILAQTLAAAAGGLQVNNTLTGGGLERVLTLSDLAAGLPAGNAEQVLVNTGGSTYAATSAILIDTTGEIELQFNVDTPNAGIDFQVASNEIRSIDRASGGQNRLIFSQGFFIVTEIGHVGLDSDGVFRMHAQLAGGPSIRARTGSTDWDILDVDVPTGTVRLYELTGVTRTLVLSTHDDGIRVAGDITNDPTTPGLTQNARVQFRNASDDIVGQCGYFTTDFFLTANQRGANLFLQVTDDAGVLVEVFDADPNDTTQLGHGPSNAFVARTTTPALGGLFANNTLTGAGFERVLTVSDIGGVSFPIDAADNEQIRWGTGQDVLQFFDGTDMQFNALDGVDFRFLGGTAGAEVMLTLLANGAMEAAFDGTVRLATTILGAEVTGTELALVNSAASSTELKVFNSAGGIVAFAVVTSGDGAIAQLDGSGNIQDRWMNFVRDGRLELFHNAVQTAHTLTLAAGGFAVDQDLNAGFVPVATRGVGGDIQGAILQVTVSRTNNTLADDAILAGFELDPSQAYLLECVLLCNGNGATNNDFQWAFDFNGEIANITTFDGHVIWYEEGLTTAVIDSTDHATGGLSGNVDFTSTADYIVVINVGIITGAGYAAGTAIDLQWAQLVTQVTATRLVEGSYMKLTRMTNFG